METNKEIRYCKSCKCELPSTNNDGLCGNCRDTNNNKTFNTFRNVLIGVLGIVGPFAIRAFMNKKESK